MEDDCIAQTKSHFEHGEQVNILVDTLCAGSMNDGDDSLIQLSAILDQYQEQSHLLDPYLEGIVTPIMTSLREKIQLRPIVPEQTHRLFRFLYLLTKTRGYKTIVKFMSHEVTDLESVFEFLASLDDSNLQFWETRYICFIWLSLICMIPFDLKRVDSGSGDPLITKLLTLCKHYLKATGKERDGASLLAARLLSRRDLCDDHLVPFIEWSKEKLENDADVFETAGILSSLCTLYQLSPRKILLPTLDDGILPLLSMPFFDKYDNNSLIRKLRMKLTQRIGLCYLKPKLAAWRYQRGSRSLRNNLEQNDEPSMKQNHQRGTTTLTDEEDEEISENLEIIIDLLLTGLRDKDTIVRWSAAKGMGRISQRLPQELAEEVIGSLLELFEENTFKTSDGSRLDLTAVSDHTWHGASLAVAELARRGLLLPERLKETIPWILLGLKFDLKRGSHSIGAHVRDASCYVCWSFARAYAPDIMAPFVQEIAQNLVVVAVFDREINVRRASSAAFQENVGRQGIFPMGIDIIQLADYFSLGIRTNSFLQVAVDIAKFVDYRYHLIDHLVAVTSKHWDKSMRVLASKSLYKLVPLDPSYFIDHVLPLLVPLSTSKDMIVSHGAVLSLGEVCLSLWECRQHNSDLEDAWGKNENLIKSIASIVPQLPSRSLTTFGSEHIREATCQLIEYMARASLISGADDNKQLIDQWKQVIRSSLERKEENVQECAVSAFGAVSRTYGICRSEVDTYLKKIEPTHMMYGRRGYALALGTLDYNMETRYSWLHDVIHKLGLASQIQIDHQANDVEAKRNAVIGLTNILKGLDGVTMVHGITLDNHLDILDTLELCLKDYSTDQRGDVGSWVRSVSMECLRYYVPVVAKLEYGKAIFTRDTNARVISALMKQSVERIDRVRDLAGSVLTDLVQSNSIDLPHHVTLKKIFSSELTFSAPGELYPIMVEVLSYPEYRLELLTGIIASAGGLTESLVRHASSSLIQYVNSLPLSTDTSGGCSREDIVCTIFDIFARYEKQDRVIIPLMDVIGLLYETGTLSQISNEKLHLKLMVLIKKESFRSKNVKKLLSAIKVYVGLISLKGTQVKTKSLQQMLSYLVHGYPRIRMEVADQLFTFLSVLDENEVNEATMEAEELITGTDWSQAVDDIKPLRNQLYDLLNVPKPTVRSS